MKSDAGFSCLVPGAPPHCFVCKQVDCAPPHITCTHLGLVMLTRPPTLGMGCAGHKMALGNDYCDGKLELNMLEGYNAANPHNLLWVVSCYSSRQLHGTVAHHSEVMPDWSMKLLSVHAHHEGSGKSGQCEHYIHPLPPHYQTAATISYCVWPEPRVNQAQHLMSLFWPGALQQWAVLAVQSVLPA